MFGYTRVKFTEICRLCATYEETRQKFYVFDETGIKLQLQTKILRHTNTKISAHDKLPKVICKNCLAKLEEFHKFWTVCQQSENMLTTYYKNAIDNENFQFTGKVYIKNTPAPQQFDEQYIMLTQNNPKKEAEVKKSESSDVTIVEIENVQNSATSSQVQFYPNPNQSEVKKQKKLETIEVGKTNENGNFIKNLQFPSVNIIPNIVDLTSTTTNLENSNILIPNSSSNSNKNNSIITTEDKNNSIITIEESLSDSSPTATENNQSETPIRRRYNCEQCSKYFRRREHLYQHVKLHSGERPFKCDNCERSFLRKEHLVRHSTAHTGQKNYTCNVCAKSFSRNDNLLKHRKTHERHIEYNCLLCKKKFVIQRYYEAHMETYHKELYDLAQTLRAVPVPPELSFGSLDD